MHPQSLQCYNVEPFIAAEAECKLVPMRDVCLAHIIRGQWQCVQPDDREVSGGDPVVRDGIPTDPLLTCSPEGKAYAFINRPIRQDDTNTESEYSWFFFLDSLFWVVAIFAPFLSDLTKLFTKEPIKGDPPYQSKNSCAGWHRITAIRLKSAFTTKSSTGGNVKISKSRFESWLEHVFLSGLKWPQNLTSSDLFTKSAKTAKKRQKDLKKMACGFTSKNHTSVVDYCSS
jgi:hypothetical protein